MSTHEGAFATVEEAVEEIRQGRMIGDEFWMRNTVAVREHEIAAGGGGDRLVENDGASKAVMRLPYMPDGHGQTFIETQINDNEKHYSDNETDKNGEEDRRNRKMTIARR